MALTQAAIRAIAIRKSIAAKSGAATPPVAANDQAPRQRAVLPDFVATILANEIKVGETIEGKPYMTLKGCEMTLPDGRTVARTVMAFDDAYHAVRAAIAAKTDVVATLTHMGGVMKVVALEVDGETRTFAKSLPKAA